MDFFLKEGDNEASITWRNRNRDKKNKKEKKNGQDLPVCRYNLTFFFMDKVIMDYLFGFGVWDSYEVECYLCE